MKRIHIPSCLAALLLAACTAAPVEPEPAEECAVAGEEPVAPAAPSPSGAAVVAEEIDRPTLRYYEIADT